MLRSRREFIHTGEVVVVEHLGLEREPAPGAILDPAPSAALEQLVAGYPEDPRPRRAGAARAEALRDQEDRREHLSCEVGRGLPVAGLAEQEADHRGEVAPVERRERRPSPATTAASNSPSVGSVSTGIFRTDFARAVLACGLATRANRPEREHLAGRIGGRAAVVSTVWTAASFRIQVSCRRA